MTFENLFCLNPAEDIVGARVLVFRLRRSDGEVAQSCGLWILLVGDCVLGQGQLEQVLHERSRIADAGLEHAQPGLGLFEFNIANAGGQGVKLDAAFVDLASQPKKIFLKINYNFRVKKN